MFASAARKPPGLDIESILQALGQPQPGMTPTYVPQLGGNASGPTFTQPAPLNSSGAVPRGRPPMLPSGHSPLPQPPSRLGSNHITVPASGNMQPAREPLNFGAPPPDQLYGTNPIGTPGIGDGIISSDPRVTKALQPGFFGKGGKGWTIMGILGDAMAAAGGGQATYMPAMLERQKREQEQQRWMAEQKVAQAKFDWEKRKDMRPDVKVLGRTAISIPFEGDPSVLYQAPSDAENYAATLGFQEGDEGYADAVMDYTLRSNGPTAYEQRRQLEDQRYGNRVNLRGVPTYANLHPRTGGGGRGNGGGPRPPTSVGGAVAPLVAKLARGEQLTPSEQQALSYYSRGGRGGGKPTLPINPSPASAGPAPIPPRPAGPRLPVRQSGPVRVSTPAEARRLKPGTQFITPDGKLKVR
jgi:hypothetical protein